MAKVLRGSRRATRASARTTGPGSPRGESGGFLQQLGLTETGGTAPGLVGIGLAMLLAIATYPIGWAIRKWRRRA